MGTTLRTIVNEALELMSEVSGAGTQEYTDDRMMKDVVRGFNLIFKKRAWEQYSQWFNGTLDGTLGVVNSNLFDPATVYIKDFEDFIRVTKNGMEKGLPVIGSRNPATVTGTTVQFWTSLRAGTTHYEKRRLQFHPITATGIVNIYAKVYPYQTWTWTKQIEFDKDLMVYSTAYMSLAADDINAQATNLMRTMLDERYKDIVGAIASHPILVAHNGPVPSAWQEQ